MLNLENKILEFAAVWKNFYNGAICTVEETKPIE